MSDLPPGFVLDDHALPAGFALDQPSMGADIAKSVAAGLGNQTLGVLGAPGLVREGLSAATDYLGNKLGFDPQRIKDGASNYLGPLANLPSPSDLRKTVTDPIVSPDYQPQTLLGKGGKLLGEYSLGLADPAALASPAGLGRAALTNVAAPAAASEGARELTQGTPYEMPAAVASAFLGGFGASKGLRALEDAKALKSATIPLSDLRSQTSAGYDAVRDANVSKPLPPNALNDTADEITQALNAKNHRPINAPDLHAIVGQIKTPAAEGAPDVADLLAARARIKEEIGSNPAGSFVALDKIERAIDKYSPGTMDQIRALDKDWTGVRSGEALDKNLAKAERRAAGANSGLNLGNTIRQRVDSFLSSPQAKFISGDARDALEKVNAGTATQNTLRDIANMVGKGHGLGGAVAGELIGHIFGNDLLGLAIGTGVGRGANSLYTRSVANSAKRASDLIRRQTPAGQQFAQRQLGTSALVTPGSISDIRTGLKGLRSERRRAAIPAGLAAIYAAGTGQ